MEKIKIEEYVKIQTDIHKIIESLSKFESEESRVAIDSLIMTQKRVNAIYVNCHKDINA